MDTGVIIDRGVLTWVARLSDHYPTLEVRTGDAQLEAQDSVLIAGLIRGLVATAVKDAATGIPYPDPEHELLDAAQWQAAREGLAGVVVNPVTGKLVPAREQMDRLLEHIDGALEDAGDARWVEAGLKTVWERGTGATRQRRAMEQGGMSALVNLYSETLTAER